MKRMKRRLAEERGSVLVLALLMLLFLTLIGISATTTTSIDLQIAQNERIYQNHFNTAEAAALHAIQWIEDASSDTIQDYANIAFLNNYQQTGAEWTPNEEAAKEFFRDPANWDWDSTSGNQNAVAMTVEDGSGNLAYPNAYFSILYAGDSTDCSQNADGSVTCAQIYHCFGLYQLTDANDPERGEVLVEIGYRRWVNL